MRSAHVQRDLERAAQAVKAKQARRKSNGADKKDKYWLKWGKRRECVNIYVKRDMKGIQLHYGTPPPRPPRTTIRSRGEMFAEGIAVCCAGNYVDLSKLDPHHTFSSSGDPLNKESRP